MSVVTLVILSACTTTAPITPTTAPTVTPTPPEQSSADLSTLATGYAAMQTASAVPVTSTPLPVTLTPKPVTYSPTTAPPATAAPSGGSGELVIESFTASTDTVHPGDTITLTWKTNTDHVYIRVVAPTSKDEKWIEGPGSGSTDYTVPVILRNPFQIALIVGPYDSQVYKMLSFSIICPDTWVFDDAPDTCPNPASRGTWTAERFEHGLMVWIGADSMIYALRDDGIYSAVYDNWKPGMPESDPSLVPPDGLFQPVRGFGLAWRNDYMRDALGWATGPEFATPITFQCDSVYKSAICILDGPEGRAKLNIWGGGWSGD